MKIQANLKQAQQRSSSQAEKKAENTRELTLRFSPTAWAKLLYFRGKSDNEVGGFGVTEADDLLFVKEFVTVKQEVTVVSVKFDDETFKRVFGNCQWALMFVVAQNNKTYARLGFNVGPGGQVLVPVEIDYGQDFGPSDHELWDAEYGANVKAIEWLSDRTNKVINSSRDDLSGYAFPYDFLDEFEKMEPEERQIILDELAERPELWDEKEVMAL